MSYVKETLLNNISCEDEEEVVVTMKAYCTCGEVSVGSVPTTDGIRNVCKTCKEYRYGKNSNCKRG